MRSAILRGDPVVRDIERWCLRHGHEDGVEPVLAVLFFNTDVAAEHYVQIKAKVAAQVKKKKFQSLRSSAHPPLDSSSNASTGEFQQLTGNYPHIRPALGIGCTKCRRMHPQLRYRLRFDD